MAVSENALRQIALRTDTYLGSLDRRLSGYQYQYDIVVSRLSLVSDAL